MRADRRLTFTEVSEELGISCGAWQFYLKIRIQDMLVKFVPWLLTAKQKHGLSVAYDWFKSAEPDKNSCKSTVTSNPISAYDYDPKIK